MNRNIGIAALALLASAAAQAEVGVSVSVGEPGFYGQIHIGDYPSPQLIYAEPVLVQHVAAPGRPVYLRVPPGHEKHWSKHCARYNACGRPVYFVRDDWYNNVYAPAYRERHGGPGGGPDHDHGHGPGNDHGGPGKGHGKGHGHD